MYRRVISHFAFSDTLYILKPLLKKKRDRITRPTEGSRLRAREMEPNLALSDTSLQETSNKNASSNQVKGAHFQ